MAVVAKLLRQKFNPPLDLVESFAGRTVLVTGATTGLGLESAKKIAAKGAQKLIITARDTKRGENAKSIIQEAGKASSSMCETDLVLLDMSSITSVKAFAEEIKAKYPALDTVILNAGTMQTKWAQSPDGWEEIIQVNTISTTLLALLLLPKLVDSASAKNPSHLTFVSSGTAVVLKSEQMKKFYDNPNALQAINEESSWPGASTQYATSKLLLEYAMRPISRSQALHDPSGEVQVIVNSTCPGMCKSDLGRGFKTNIIFKLLIGLLYLLIARTAEQGSNTYLTAASNGAESQGKLFKDDKFYYAGEMIEGVEGKKFGEKMWEEIKGVLLKIDPSVKGIVESH